MLRVLVGALRRAPNALPRYKTASVKISFQAVGQTNNFFSLAGHFQPNHTSNLLSNARIKDISNNIVTRSVTKFSIGKGRRKAVKVVLRRFYRLHWGGWIRTKCGRQKKLWKKSAARKRRLRQHVFCNATQCTLLDKMVGSYWRRPKYYVDDPYEPYHTREEFRTTYIKPKPYFPNEEKISGTQA